MTRYALFGEIMMRLKSPDHERLFQTRNLEVTMGGAEANVAVGLARLGEDATFITALPENDLGYRVRDELRCQGVDTSRLQFMPGRLGLYFVEAGASLRAPRVVYDRAGSCVAMAAPEDYHWKTLLGDRDWFHVTGITPAVSKAAMNATLTAMETAKAMGLTVSCDLNLRTALWKYGQDHVEIYRRMMEFTDLVIGNEGHFNSCLGLDVKVKETDITDNPDAYRALADEALGTWPGLRRVAVTVRRTFSADHQAIAAVLATRENMWVSPVMDIPYIVDRIGGGDALAAGLLHGLAHTGDSQKTIDFAVAAGAIKHSIPGDFLRATKPEIQALANGASGRDQR